MTRSLQFLGCLMLLYMVCSIPTLTGTGGQSRAETVKQPPQVPKTVHKTSTSLAKKTDGSSSGSQQKKRAAYNACVAGCKKNAAVGVGAVIGGAAEKYKACLRACRQKYGS